MIERIEDVLHADVNLSCLDLKDKLNEVIDLVNDTKKEVEILIKARKYEPN